MDIYQRRETKVIMAKQKLHECDDDDRDNNNCSIGLNNVSSSGSSSSSSSRSSPSSPLLVDNNSNASSSTAATDNHDTDADGNTDSSRVEIINPVNNTRKGYDDEVCIIKPLF